MSSSCIEVRLIGGCVSKHSAAEFKNFGSFKAWACTAFHIKNLEYDIYSGYGLNPNEFPLMLRASNDIFTYPKVIYLMKGSLEYGFVLWYIVDKKAKTKLTCCVIA
jgi:hypothetical protein